ncbi:MAG TPA: hypothetical protein VLJ11_14235, partial [Bryobacteraceae bacterium]|nr:hypothetical protein [Bryobacteraceae bacterium]
VFALVILATYLPQGLWVSSFPDSFFNPPLGPTFFFFHGFPGAPFFYELNGFLVFATVCMLFGCWTRIASVAFSLGFTFLQAWEYSFGKINHEFVIVPIPILFAWAGWGMAWSVDGRRRQNTASPTKAMPIALFAFILSIMMLSAGAPKVISGWLNPWTHAVLAKVVIAHFVMGSATWFSHEALKIRSGWFWEPLDWFSCALEIAFICLFFRRFLMRLVCALATLFHFGIVLLMKITSWGNVLSYGAFADWDGMVKFFPFSLIRSLGNLVCGASQISVLTIATVTTAVYLSFGNPVAKLVARTPQEADFRIGTFLVILAAITGVVFLARLVLRIRAGARSESVPELRPAGILQKKL